MTSQLNQPTETHKCCRETGEEHHCRNKAKKTIPLTQVTESQHDGCGCKNGESKSESEKAHRCCRETTPS